MPFTLGQRWISDTESELGLGTVVALDARMVTLLFPAIGENRLYSRNDSPITRVMFNPGDTITLLYYAEQFSDENGEFDRSMFGNPKESYMFSNNVHEDEPNWDAVRFTIGGERTQLKLVVSKP